jgi:hypothetical protein
MRARHIRRWTVANLAAVLVASLVVAAPVAAAQTYGVTHSSPTPSTVDYSDLVTFRGAYTCVNGVDPADLCPTTTLTHTATFALRLAGDAAFTTVQTVTTSFRFTSSAGGCASTCAINFSVVWKAGRAPGSISMPAGVYDVRLATTLTADEVVLDGALTIDREDTTTTSTGPTSGEAGTALALGATVADADLGMFAGTSLFLPDVNFGASSPISFALYDATNATLVAGPVAVAVGGAGATVGSPTLTLPAAGTYQLRTTYPGNGFYRPSEDLDTVTVTASSVNTPPTLDLPGPITAEATSPAGATVTYAATASDIEDDPDPGVTCDWASGATFPLGTTTVSCDATDGDGATTSGSFTVTVADTTPPHHVAFTDGGLVDGLTYAFWFVPPGPDGCTAVDDGSGLASCVVEGYSDEIGTHTVTATATDLAGNVASTSLDYSVAAWTLAGADGALGSDGLGATKAGTPVQLRFEAFAGATELTSVAAIVGLSQTRVDCADGSPLEAPEPAASRGPLRRAGGEFAWSWLAPREPGTCWQVAVETADGSELAATFELR